MRNSSPTNHASPETAYSENRARGTTPRAAIGEYAGVGVKGRQVPARSARSTRRTAPSAIRNAASARTSIPIRRRSAAGRRPRTEGSASSIVDPAPSAADPEASTAASRRSSTMMTTPRAAWIGLTAAGDGRRGEGARTNRPRRFPGAYPGAARPPRMRVIAHGGAGESRTSRLPDRRPSTRQPAAASTPTRPSTRSRRRSASSNRTRGSTPASAVRSSPTGSSAPTRA